MRALFNGQASKAVVAALIGLATSLLGHYADKWWEPAAAAAVTAVAVFLVPNQSGDVTPAKSGPGGPGGS